MIGADAEDAGRPFGNSENPLENPASPPLSGVLSKGQHLSGGSLQRMPFLR